MFTFLSGYSQTYLNHCCRGTTNIIDTNEWEPYNDWVLLFVDQFNFLDTIAWRNDYPWGRNLYCAEIDIGYYTDCNNDSLRGDTFLLIAKEDSVYKRNVPDWSNTDPLVCDDDTVGINKQWFANTEGMLFSNSKLLYDRFEFRCKIPTIRGLNPSFRLYTDCGQKIDVFEFLDKTYNSTTNGKIIKLTYHRRLDCDDEGNKVLCQCKFTHSSDFITRLSYIFS